MGVEFTKDRNSLFTRTLCYLWNRKSIYRRRSLLIVWMTYIGEICTSEMAFTYMLWNCCIFLYRMFCEKKILLKQLHSYSTNRIFQNMMSPVFLQIDTIIWKCAAILLNWSASFLHIWITICQYLFDTWLSLLPSPAASPASHLITTQKSLYSALASFATRVDFRNVKNFIFSINGLICKHNFFWTILYLTVIGSLCAHFKVFQSFALQLMKRNTCFVSTSFVKTESATDYANVAR